MRPSSSPGHAPAAIGPTVTPARRLVLELSARAVEAPPREWGASADELARRADEDPSARDALLYYAAAIARDSGDHARADALLLRALAAGPERLAWRQEFELQLALADALLRGDPAAARARLASLPPHETEPAYPLLAEAAVLVVEGRRRDGEDAMLRWRAGAAASALGSARLEVGNAWAIELVEERLGIPRRPRPGSDGVVVERHGPATRAAMVLAGFVFALSFAALTVVAGIAAARATTGRERLGLGVTALALAGVVAYGVGLVVRGARGATRRRRGRAERLDAALLRILNASALLWLPPIVLAAGWWATGDLRSFVLGRARGATGTAWELLVLWTAWVLQVAAHEAGHAAAALLAGGRVEEVAIGPLRWFRDGARWRWARRPAGLLFGGHVRATLPEPWGRARFLLHVAGGPLASAALGAACAAPLLAGGVHDPALVHLLRSGALIGAWGVLTSVVPTGGRLGQNDARIALEALRGGFWHGSVGARLAAHVAAGHRARDWDVPAEEIERAARASRDGAGWGLLLAAARALDGGDVAVARRVLAELLSDARLDPALRSEALLQAALAAALLDGDAVRARQRIAEARQAGAGDYAKLAEAAAACADGAHDAARAALVAWQAGVDAGPDAASVRTGNHWAVDAIAARLEAAEPAEPAGAAG